MDDNDKSSDYESVYEIVMLNMTVAARFHMDLVVKIRLILTIPHIT